MLFGPHAPPEGTMNRNRAQTLIQNPACFRNRMMIEKTRKPRNTGLSTFKGIFLYQSVKTWHAPCNSPSSDSVHYPVSGTLVQAGRGFPSLHRAHTATATSPTRFGALDTGRSGVPSLHRDLRRKARVPAVLGTLVQAGRGFPLLLLSEMDLQPPAVIDLATGPLAQQWPGRHHRQQQPPITQTHAPVHVFAVELELTFLHLAFSLEQQRKTAVDDLAVGLGFVVEPHHQPVARHVDLLQLAGVRRGQATNHQADHHPDNRQRTDDPRE